MKEFTTSDIFGTAIEWSSVRTVKVTIPDDVIERIQVARGLLNSADFINHITINAGKSEVVQYENYYDHDEPLEELKYDDLEYFRISVEEIKVYDNASYYIMHNKHTSDFLEVEIPE